MLSLYPREHKKKQNEANSIFIGSRPVIGRLCGREEDRRSLGYFNIRYDNPQDSLNNWQYRKDRVCQFIKDHELDIVGMQEVLHNQFQDLRAGLPEYDGIGVGRDDGKTAGEYAPLFYRKDKYEVLDSNTFWLAEIPIA